MSSPQETWQLDTKVIGRTTLTYSQLDSTSNKANEFAASPTHHGLAIIAGEQTNGRGQHGRTWLAPTGKSVLMSVLIFPPANLKRSAFMTAWAATGVCETIRSLLGIQAKIKWPNDILLDGRKVAGILIEQGKAIVAGIGLNVSQTREEFNLAGLPLAASLREFSPHPLNTQEVARALLRNLDDAYRKLESGNSVNILESWQAGLGLLGENVVLEERNNLHRGRLIALELDRLALETKEGFYAEFQPESVFRLGLDLPAGY